MLANLISSCNKMTKISLNLEVVPLNNSNSSSNSSPNSSSSGTLILNSSSSNGQHLNNLLNLCSSNLQPPPQVWVALLVSHHSHLSTQVQWRLHWIPVLQHQPKLLVAMFPRADKHKLEAITLHLERINHSLQFKRRSLRTLAMASPRSSSFILSTQQQAFAFAPRIS